MTRSISILGATGSVGEQTLDLIRRNRDEWQVEALTANCSAQQLAVFAREFGAKIAVVSDESCLAELREALAANIGGDRGLDLSLANIVVQPGGKPVITKFIQTSMNAGDGVLYRVPLPVPDRG